MTTRCADNAVVAGTVLLIIVLLGGTIVRNSEWQDRVSIWEDAVKKSPQKARVNYQLGRECGDAGDRARAFFYMGKAKQLDASFFNRYLSRAEDYRQRGQLPEAAAEYRKMLQEDPGQPVLRNDLGCVLHELGRLDESFTEFTTAITLNPKYAMAYANRGVIRVEQGTLDMAVQDYQRAVELDPRNASFRAKLGFALYRMGMIREAVAAYEAALEIDPKQEDAKKALEQLKPTR